MSQGDGNPPAPIRVNVDEIDQEVGLAGSGGSVKPIPRTYSEMAVVYMAYVAGIAGIFFTLLFFMEWWWIAHSIKLPEVIDPKNPDIDHLQKTINLHKSLSDMYTDRSIKLFDSFVGKALIPVLSTLIGFIIGSKATKDRG